MTKEEQRIAIAEACGLADATTLQARLEDHEEAVAYAYYNDRAAPTPPIPDYLNDLNAMHGAASHIPVDDLDDYYDHLAEAAGYKFDGGDDRNAHLFACVDATAAQRAEAFLKTCNLWKDL